MFGGVVRWMVIGQGECVRQHNYFRTPHGHVLPQYSHDVVVGWFINGSIYEVYFKLTVAVLSF